MLLTEVCLITDDVLRLARFYQTILKTNADGDAVHMAFATAGCRLAIYAKAAAIQDMKFDFPHGAGCGQTTLMFRTEDVAEDYARLTALGVDFITAPTTYPWGATSFHFRDPDGNIVGFVSTPD